MTNHDNAFRILIDQALKVWRLRRAIYSPEIARTTFLKAKLLMQSDNGPEAAVLFKEARNIRNSLPGVMIKPDEQLREADFDELVTFFSR